MSGAVTRGQGRAVISRQPCGGRGGAYTSGGENRYTVFVGQKYFRTMSAEFVKIIGVCVLSASVCVLLKSAAPSFALLTTLFVSVCVVGVCAAHFLPFLEFFRNLAEQTSFSPYISVLTKVCGIGILTRTACEICRDAGENAIASKAELAGKTAVLMCALPIIKNLFEQIKDFVN